MKKLIGIFIFILTNTVNLWAADISGRILSQQTVKDVNTSNFTQLERKKFEASLQVSPNKGLANAVVYMEKVSGWKSSPEKLRKVKLDQKNNAFNPRITPMVVGEELVIVNSDKAFHNAHGFIDGSTIFISNLPFQQESKHVLTKEEILMVKCEVHLDMIGFVLVLNNPYFSVTDADGNYKVKDLPPGEYNLVIWHEALGKKMQKVVVKGEKEKINSDFDFASIRH